MATDDAYSRSESAPHESWAKARFVVAGTTARRCSPPLLAGNCAQRSTPLHRLTLAFSVSRDEEYVRLYAVSDQETIDLGWRGHNFLLLTLARQRLADAEAGFPDTTCGWIHTSALARDPEMHPARLNLNVFRLRRHFAARGILDARHAVERRLGTGQIRIGTSRIRIARL